MRNRDRSKIRERKQCLIRHFADLTDRLYAARKQSVLYPCWESDVTDCNVIRKLWRWLKLAHFLFAFGLSTRTPRNSSGPLIKRRFRLAFSSLFAAAFNQ
jgi:hypothetical protein